MVFSDINDGTGLIQECERLTNLGAAKISGNTSLLKDFTARINNAIDRFFTIAFQNDANWNFDDRRYADSSSELPIATTNIVSGTKDYLFDSSLLMVTQVFAKDANGTFNELVEQDDKNEPRAYDLQSTTGTPTHYELVGSSILLDPTPNYNSTGGLKITFKRNGVKFAYTDGAITPGIPSLFHPYLARYASFQYATEKRLAHAGAIKIMVNEDELEIAKFMANRAKPKRSGFKVRQESTR